MRVDVYGSTFRPSQLDVEGLRLRERERERAREREREREREV